MALHLVHCISALHVLDDCRQVARACKMGKSKEIKRYANRRLYDAETSKTITLEDVADCIKNGYDVKVIDFYPGRFWLLRCYNCLEKG